WCQPHGHRRAVCRGPRADRRLLDLGGQGHGRGRGLGEALPQSHAGSERDRDPAVLRGGRSGRVCDARGALDAAWGGAREARRRLILSAALSLAVLFEKASVTAGATHQAIEATCRIERARLIAGLARLVRDIDRAEELAQDALVIWAPSPTRASRSS